MKEFIARVPQQLAIDFLWEHPRAMLMADLGIGKTVAALTHYEKLQLLGIETKPALILAPLRVARTVWPEEPPKWNHLAHTEVVPIVGNTEQRKIALKCDAPFFSINYDNLVWLLEYLEGKWPFGATIADESTRLSGLRVGLRTSSTGKTFVQGQGTVRARRLAKMAWSNKDARWTNLTATPSPNGLSKTYGQSWFCDFGKALGNTFTAFEQRFFTTGYDGFKLEPRPHADKQIHELMKPFCLALLAKDYLPIKDPINVSIYVTLPKKARQQYQEMKNKLYLKFGKREVEAVSAGTKAGKLSQLASGAIYLDPDVDDDSDPKAKDWIEVHDEKLQALSSIIEEAGGMPLIVAYQFKSDRARLKKAFPKMRFLDSRKDEADFKAGKIQLLGCHPASAGHGIDGFQNVTNRIVFFTQWPDYELRDQIIGRIGPVRQFQAGFERPVYIYDIIAVDTRDEDVLVSHGEKKEIQDLLLGAMRR